MKINFSQNGSNQAAQWAHKKQEMIEKAARLKEQRKQNLASSGERAISSSLENNQISQRMEAVQYYQAPQQPFQQAPAYGGARSSNPNVNQAQKYIPPTTSLDYQEQLQQQQLAQINQVLQSKKQLNHQNQSNIQPSHYGQQQQYYDNTPQQHFYSNQPMYNQYQSYNDEHQQYLSGQKSKQVQSKITPPLGKPPQQPQSLKPNLSNRYISDEDQQYQASIQQAQTMAQPTKNPSRTRQPNKPPTGYQPPVPGMQQPRRPGQVNQQQNPLDERPLDKNSNNIIDLDENSGPLYQCPQGCGRSFAQKALQKHAKICVKVFQKKRKEFNSQKHRIVDNEQVNHIKRIDQVEKKYQAKLKKSNWKAESQAFRAVVKAGKGGKLTAQEMVSMNQMQTMNLIECQYCGRKFNDTAATRHIPYCQQKAAAAKYRPNKYR